MGWRLQSIDPIREVIPCICLPDWLKSEVMTDDELYQGFLSRCIILNFLIIRKFFALELFFVALEMSGSSDSDEFYDAEDLTPCKTIR